MLARTLFALCLLFASSEPVFGQAVALFVSGPGATIEIPGISTRATGYVGVAIFMGSRLNSGAGPATVAFCPGKSLIEIRPRTTVAFKGNQVLPETAIAKRTPVPSCEMPAIDARPRPSTMDDPATRDSTSAPSLPSGDLMSAVSLAAGYERSGKLPEALALYRRIRVTWPHATWTSNAIDRIVRAHILVPRVGDPKAIALIPPVSNPGGGKVFAFLVGISQYKKGNGIEPLRFADKDAESFRDFLQSERGGVPKEQIRLLRNQEATRDRIDHDLAEFVKGKAGKNNTLILFIAAHGRYICLNRAPGAKLNAPCPPGSPDEQPFILTYDSRPDDPNVSAYPMAEFYRLITRRAADFGKVVVYVDVCHAGTVGNLPRSTLLSPASVEDIFSSREGDIGVMLASARQKPERRDDEYAYESQDFGGGHGVFTYFVLEGLNGKVEPADQGKVLFLDLFAHVQKQVRLYTKNRQTPKETGNADNLVLLDNAGKKKGIPLGPVTVKDITGQRRRGQATSSATALVTEPNAANSPDSDRVALEEAGQSVIVEYLKGEQSPPTKQDFERCAQDFERALQQAPDASFDRSRYLFCKGRALIFDKSYGPAMELLEQSILLDPERSYAYNALGIACLEQVPRDVVFYDRAIRAFDDAIRFAPYWAYPRHNRALTLTQRGDYGGAVREYEDAIALAPQYAYLPYNLGLLYQDMADFPHARAYYQDAERVAEQMCLARPGSNPGACPERVPPRTGLASLEARKGKRENAERMYRAALEDAPADLTANHDLAALLFQWRGREADAARLWARNLRTDPNHLPSLVGYSDLLSRECRFAEALPLYRLILGAMPDYVPAQIGFGRALVATGDTKQAEPLIAKLTKVRGSDAQFRALQAEYLDRMGQDARPAWNEAIRLTENRETRKELIARRDRKYVCSPSK